MYSSITYFIFKCHTPRKSLSFSWVFIMMRRLGRATNKQENTIYWCNKHYHLLSQSHFLLLPLSRSFLPSENKKDWQRTPTHTHQWVDLCLIELAHYTTTPSYRDRHSCTAAAAVHCRRGYLWSPWGSIRQEKPYAAYCMPIGRWGHGEYVFRWSNLC